MLASEYISFGLCSVLKKQLFDVLLTTTTIGGLISNIVYDMLHDYKF